MTALGNHALTSDNTCDKVWRQMTSSPIGIVPALSRKKMDFFIQTKVLNLLTHLLTFSCLLLHLLGILIDQACSIKGLDQVFFASCVQSDWKPKNLTNFQWGIVLEFISDKFVSQATNKYFVKIHKVISIWRNCWPIESGPKTRGRVNVKLSVMDSKYYVLDLFSLHF